MAVGRDKYQSHCNEGVLRVHKINLRYFKCPFSGLLSHGLIQSMRTYLHRKNKSNLSDDDAAAKHFEMSMDYMLRLLRLLAGMVAL